MGISAAPATTCTSHLSFSHHPVHLDHCDSAGSNAIKKLPSSPEDALVHTVLSLSSEACGKSPCSSILFAAFSRPYNSPSEICQAYFCLGCFAHSEGAGAPFPREPQLRSGLATIHSPASVTSYTLHLRIVRAQKLQTRYFTLYLVLT